MGRNSIAPLTFFGRDSRQVFFFAFVATLIAKVWLAFVVPITGDEALFYWWGVYPNWGYYDHPPMVGWMLALLRPLGDALIFLRLITVISTFVIALAIVDLVRRLLPDDFNRPWIAGSLYLLTPISWFGVPVTNDTPLLIFVFFSIYFFVRAEMMAGLSGLAGKPAMARSLALFFASGICLGLAFLSKYLAVVAFFGFCVALFRPRHWGGLGPKHAVTGVLIIGLASFPLVLINLFYNANNCWNNVMFNLINRNEGASIGIENPLVFLLMLVYLFTPWLVWSLVREGRTVTTNKLVFLVAVTPFGFFLLVSLVKTIGLHWVVGFIPMVFVLAALYLSQKVLRRCLIWTALFSVTHLVAFIGVFSVPHYWMSYSAGAKALGFVYDAPQLADLAMRGADNDTVLMAEGYSPGSILGYHAKRYTPVFGPGSRYARQDDFHVNFRELDGKTVRLLLRRIRPESDFLPYFERVDIQPLTLEGRAYWVVEGKGFRFEAYRATVLSEIAARYYQIPDFLPVFGCPFLEKYAI